MSKFYVSLGITKAKWRHYRFWLCALVLCEGLMLAFNHLLLEIYLIIAVLFLGGFILRVLRLYPSEEEPLTLDFFAFVTAICFAFVGAWLDHSLWRFVLILCSSVIIMPHFIYIANDK